MYLPPEVTSEIEARICRKGVQDRLNLIRDVLVGLASCYTDQDALLLKLTTVQEQPTSTATLLMTFYSWILRQH